MTRTSTTSLEQNRRAALAFASAAAALQIGRVILWGHWPPVRELPVDIDGYLAAAFQVIGAASVSRRGSMQVATLAASWGVWCGIMYRSFTEQLADATRHAGHERFVIAIKGVLLILAVIGLTGAIRASSPPPE